MPLLADGLYASTILKRLKAKNGSVVSIAPILTI